nr:MAG TPA: minor capsid protein [Caudoviricetes sp.]
MAKEQNKFDKQHKQNIKQQEKRIDTLYKNAIDEIVSISNAISKIKPDTPFSFSDYPITRKRLNDLLVAFKKQMEVAILSGVRSAWTLANNKNNELANRVFGENVGKLTQRQYRQYYSNNEEARQAFEQRKINGLSLSERVWNYADQFKDEMELGLDIGIRNGRSADALSRDLRSYLKEPNKLFRRVRNEYGQLVLSERAKSYNPGRGVYRSSYKNARRLAATETNTAYRTADHLRWEKMDFVVGIEIHLSNNHTLNGKPFHDICDELAGKYPKSFKFTGWHPHCRCFATTILKTPEEIKSGKPSKNEVKELPSNFKEWLENNKERIDNASSLPYFIKDNFKDGEFIGQQNTAEPPTIVAEKPKLKPTLEKAKLRHEQRTKEQIEDIRRRANFRAKTIRTAKAYLKDYKGISNPYLRALKSSVKYGDWAGARKMMIELAKNKRALIEKALGLINEPKGVDISTLKKLMQNGSIKQLQEESNKVEQLAKESSIKSVESICEYIKDFNIEHKEVSEFKKQPTTEQIIKRLGGGDLTIGSCSSLAFAYAGNKAGLDVIDYRGGKSRSFFSRDPNIAKITEALGGVIVEHYNDFSAVKEVMKKTVVGKEYYFATGEHAAIIRTTENGVEYLELQTVKENGFKPLNNRELRERFGAHKSYSVYGIKIPHTTFLIDVESFKNVRGLKELFGYINTNENKQMKGGKGTAK